MSYLTCDSNEQKPASLTCTYPCGHCKALLNPFCQNPLVLLTLARQVWIRSFACYAVGVSFYSSQAPESLFPGRFHLFFASHQLWHVCVVIGE